MKIGYARVSTYEQNLDLQLDALTEASCDKIYQEKVSGMKKNRPELNKLQDQLRPGDTVIVWKLDRLGRSMKELLHIVGEWEKKEIAFVSITDKVTFDDSPFGKLIFHMMACLSQFERDIISARTKAGLASARKKGRIGGRKKGLTKQAQNTAAAAAALYQQDVAPVKDLAEQLGISVTTFYKYLKYMKVPTRDAPPINPTVNSTKQRKKAKGIA